MTNRDLEIYQVLPVTARYLPASRQLEISFNTGASYRWPVDALEMIERTEDGSNWVQIPRPTDEQLANVRIWNNKELVEFTDLDQHFSIPGLMAGQLGSKRWMAKLLASAA